MSTVYIIAMMLASNRDPLLEYDEINELEQKRDEMKEEVDILEVEATKEEQLLYASQLTTDHIPPNGNVWHSRDSRTGALWRCNLGSL
jgi:hypothetical protein